MLNGLDLFSGIGGMSYALRDYVRPVAYCEIDRYCQGVLLSRMGSNDLRIAPIWDDVRTLSFGDIDRKAIDILYGGFPCQDISVAGNGKGLEGERSGLFFEIVRLAKEIKPPFLFLENVPAICSRGGLRVIREIAEMGFSARWCCISAASVGALHRRERWFLLGYAEHYGSSRAEKRRSDEETVQNVSEGENQTFKSQGTSSPRVLASESFPYPYNSRNSASQHDSQGESKTFEFWYKPFPESDGCSSALSNSSSPSMRKDLRSSHGNEEEDGKREVQFLDSFRSEVSNPDGEGLEGYGEVSCGSKAKYTFPSDSGDAGIYGSREEWQKIVSSVRRTTNGVPCHMDRIRGLGNAMVPQQAKEAFEILMGLK